MKDGKISDQNKDEVVEPVVPEQNDDKVAYETYSKVLGEKKKTALENKTLKEQLDALELEEENSIKAELEKNDQYKELNEILAEEVKDLKETITSSDIKILNSYKLQAFKDALPGKISNQQYLSFVNLKDIIIDEGDKVNPESVKVAVDKFMIDHASLIKIDETELPSYTPGNTRTEGITAEEFKKLPLAEKNKRHGEFRAAEKAREKAKA